MMNAWWQETTTTAWSRGASRALVAQGVSAAAMPGARHDAENNNARPKPRVLHRTENARLQPRVLTGQFTQVAKTDEM